jgi:hypothetical protein
MEVSFLAAGVRLTKEFTPSDVTPYPHVKNFTSHRENVSSIIGFKALLESHAAKGHCLLKGTLLRDLKDESRAGSTSATSMTGWLCFDIDRIEGVSEVEQFIYTCLPPECHGVSYVVQYSASYVARGPSAGLSAHVFMLLDKEYPAPLLKEWLRNINLSQPTLSAAMGLNPAGTTLKWRLDPTVAQNDKLIYIAPPICKGFTPALAEHIALVTKKRPKLTPSITGLNAAKIDQQVQDKLNELRAAQGLKKFKAKMKGEVMTNPERVLEYEIKQERGFTYFNLQGGDSWGYFHPEENPDGIYNFKGEPPYLTKALLPDYWRQQQRDHKEEQGEGECEYFVFRDLRSAAYFNGWYDRGQDRVHLFPAKGKEQLHDFLAQHGYSQPDYIPDYNVVFDQHSDTVFDRNKRIVNLYHPSEYMRAATKRIEYRLPPTIGALIEHVTGNNPEVMEHYLNWLAVMIQHKVMTQTAWVLHGTQGTGKGVLVNHVLKPIIGHEYVKVMQLSHLEEQFNPWLERCILLIIDEASVEDIKKAGALMQKLKNWVTEPNVTVRAMHSAPYEAQNHVNIMFTTNMHDPIVIHQNDRRFNVATRQQEPIVMTPKMFNAIQQELQDFTDYLLSRPASIEKAKEIIDTPDREQMKELTQSSIAVAAHKLLKGDAEFFTLNAPPEQTGPSLKTFNGEQLDVSSEYLKLIQRIIKDKTVRLSRTDLFVLFEHTIGGMPPTAHKLTSTLKHHDIQTKRMTLASGGSPEYGIEIAFKITDNVKQWAKARESEKAAKANVVSTKRA